MKTNEFFDLLCSPASLGACFQQLDNDLHHAFAYWRMQLGLNHRDPDQNIGELIGLTADSDIKSLQILFPNYFELATELDFNVQHYKRKPTPGWDYSKLFDGRYTRKTHMLPPLYRDFVFDFIGPNAELYDKLGPSLYRRKGYTTKTNHFIINGQPQAGKDTLVDYMTESAFPDGLERISSIDEIRQFLTEISSGTGMDFTLNKRPPQRRALSNVKIAIEKELGLTSWAVKNKILKADTQKRWSTTMIREPNSIQLLRDLLSVSEAKIEISTVYVYNPAPPPEGAASDSGTSYYPYDYVVLNDEGKKELADTANQLIYASIAYDR